MRMHPRRFGAYNMSARAASAFTNAYFKSKKTNNTYTRNSNNTADNRAIVMISVIIGFIVLVLVLASMN